MTQYLLSVHSVEGATQLSDELMQEAYAAVDALNAEIMTAGAWVFGGGLHPADTATVVRVVDGETLMTDGGVAGCGKAQNCVEVCPKGIPLVDSIAMVSRQATKHMLFGWLLK